MTADERKIIDVLITHPPTKNAWDAPIQEAGKAMPGWDSAMARSFAESMRARGLVQIKAKAGTRNDVEDNQESWWELGDAILASYKGISIELRPVELQQGGWKADFTLFENIGSETRSTLYDGTVTYPSRETAKLAALDSAWTIIDGK